MRPFPGETSVPRPSQNPDRGRLTKSAEATTTLLTPPVSLSYHVTEESIRFVVTVTDLWRSRSLLRAAQWQVPVPESLKDPPGIDRKCQL